jgi:hypothetical protein
LQGLALARERMRELSGPAPVSEQPDERQNTAGKRR